MELDNGDWYAFVWGGIGDNNRFTKTWKQTSIGDVTGKRVDLKFKGEVVNGNHSLCLYVNGRREIVIDEYTSTVENSQSSVMGNVAKYASTGGVWIVTHELNLVPTKGSNYIDLTNDRGRAYFKNASFAYAYPIDANDKLIAGYKYEKMNNCDDGAYSQSVVNRVNSISSIGDSYMTISIDFREY